MHVCWLDTCFYAGLTIPVMWWRHIWSRFTLWTGLTQLALSLSFQFFVPLCLTHFLSMHCIHLTWSLTTWLDFALISFILIYALLNKCHVATPHLPLLPSTLQEHPYPFDSDYIYLKLVEYRQNLCSFPGFRKIMQMEVMELPSFWDLWESPKYIEDTHHNWLTIKMACYRLCWYTGISVIYCATCNVKQ